MKLSFKNTAAIACLGALLYGLQIFSPYWLHPVLYWPLQTSYPLGRYPNPGASILVLMINAILVSVVICLLISKKWRQPTTAPDEASVPAGKSVRGKTWFHALKLAGWVAGIQILGFMALLSFPLLNMFVVLGPMAHWTNPGPFKRPLFEAVVGQVRLAGLKPEEQRQFYFDEPANLKSLHLYNQDQPQYKGWGTGHVWAELSSDNKLKVVIMTRPIGHMGSYGFAYSDVILKPKPMDEANDCFSIEVPGSLGYWGLNWVRPGMKVDDHWWRVQCSD